MSGSRKAEAHFCLLAQTDTLDPLDPFDQSQDFGSLNLCVPERFDKGFPRLVETSDGESSIEIKDLRRTPVCESDLNFLGSRDLLALVPETNLATSLPQSAMYAGRWMASASAFAAASSTDIDLKDAADAAATVAAASVDYPDLVRKTLHQQAEAAAAPIPEIEAFGDGLIKDQNGEI